MGRFFNYDNWFFRFLAKLGDLILLNFLIIIFSLPIITIGATITAAHYTALKIRRDENYVIKNFWKSFKLNFKQSTVMWLILLVYVISLGIAMSMLLSGVDKMGTVMHVLFFVSAVFGLFIILWMFPLQARFVNTIGGTIRNAFLLSIKHLWRTLCMVLAVVLPIVLFVLSVQLYGILILFGFSAPFYLCALLYNKVFEDLEESTV